MIPIVIISFNNYKYVDNTIKQLEKINKEYCNNIIIVDNESICKDTIAYLKTLPYQIIYNKNNGPWICPEVNAHIYDMLPDKFIITDPDMQFNQNLPINFIEILANLSDKYQANRVGFALDISDYDKMYQMPYINDKTIYEWESQFWNNMIPDDDYELYVQDIDTTFCLVNKKYMDIPCKIRIAGNFTAKHLPWYIENPLFNTYELYLSLFKNTGISTTAKMILQYMQEKYVKIIKRDETFIIEKSDSNISFWNNIYTNWESETFDVFDKFLSKDKMFIDIGSWIGTTSMYGSRKSKHVFCIEADTQSFQDLSRNMKTNCTNNYTLIHNAIYHSDNIDIKFGKNKFLDDSKMNDSTSQIYLDNNIQDSYDSYFIITISLQSIINKYNIKQGDLSLIKVDIEGGEEHILEDLFRIHKEYQVPLYISFHYEWWNNKDLNRFSFLSEELKNNITCNPFISILLLYTLEDLK